MDDPFELANSVVSGVALQFGYKGQQACAYIQESRVSSSTIELIGRGRKSVWIRDSTFEQCTVTGTRANGYWLNSAHWNDCVFKGVFRDCVFGRDHRDRDPSATDYVVRNCDFSEANLLLIEFRGGLDRESCRFASWPTVVIAKHELDMQALSQQDLPPHLKSSLRRRFLGPENWVVRDVSEYDSSDFDLYCVLHGQPGIYFHGAPFAAEPTREEIEAASSRYLEQSRKRRLYSFWGFVTQSVSITTVERHGSEAIFTLKADKEPGVPIPESIRVRLTGVTKLELANADYLATAGNTRTFRLMGARIADELDSVSLKGHRKSLGTICLAYEGISVARGDGSTEPIESLSQWADYFA